MRRGSPLLSRLATYHSDIFDKYAFLDIGYSAPPLKLTAQGIDKLNDVTLQTEGYEPSGYWKWFNETGAGRVLDAHVSISIMKLGLCIDDMLSEVRD